MNVAPWVGHRLSYGRRFFGLIEPKDSTPNAQRPTSKKEIGAGRQEIADSLRPLLRKLRLSPRLFLQSALLTPLVPAPRRDCPSSRSSARFLPRCPMSGKARSRRL